MNAEDWNQRLHETLSREEVSASEKIQELLQLGVDRFGTEMGHLARIDVGPGRYIVTEVAGPKPSVEKGGEADLSTTYCRTVLSEGQTQSYSNAPEQGWAGDPAHETFGLACYLGAKVLVDEKLYGTVCFSGRAPRRTSFEEEDRAFAELIAQGIGREIEKTRREGTLIEARHRLERTENLLNRVQGIADVGGWELQTQDWEVYWTDQAQQMLGLGETETAQMESLLTRLEPEAQRRLRLGLAKAVELVEPFTVEVQLREGLGECEWLEVHGLPHAKDKGVSTVVGTIRDITEQKRRLEEVERARKESVTRLARAAEYRDNETGEHIRRVGKMSARLAEALGRPEEWKSRIREAAPLHDVGKIAIPDDILLKEGPLTDEEYKEMKTHTLVGADLLGGGESELVKMAERIARHHHERFDGGGYPDGLEGEAISLSARIVCVADAFDAMTSDRPYREAMPAEKAFSILEEEAGTQFDPEVVGAALQERDALVS